MLSTTIIVLEEAIVAFQNVVKNDQEPPAYQARLFSSFVEPLQQMALTQASEESSPPNAVPQPPEVQSDVIPIANIRYTPPSTLQDHPCHLARGLMQEQMDVTADGYALCIDPMASLADMQFTDIFPSEDVNYWLVPWVVSVLSQDGITNGNPKVIHAPWLGQIISTPSDRFMMLIINMIFVVIDVFLCFFLFIYSFSSMSRVKLTRQQMQDRNLKVPTTRTKYMDTRA